MHTDEVTGELCVVEPGKSYTVAAVAEIMDCSPNSVYRLIDAGTLKAYGIGKGGKRIFGQVLLEYMGVSA
jgi:excisionase family DNA binding protein